MKAPFLSRYSRWQLVVTAFWSAWLSGCFPMVSGPSTPSLPSYTEEHVEADSLFSYTGYAIGPLRLAHYRRTALTKGRRISRMRLTEGDVEWHVSCLKQVREQGERRVCAVRSGQQRGVIVDGAKGSDPLSGKVRGALHLTLDGGNQGALMRGERTTTVVVRGAEGPIGAVLPASRLTSLRIVKSATSKERQWLRVLALLHAVQPDLWESGMVGVDAAPAGDAFDLRDREGDDPPADKAFLAAIDTLADELEREDAGAFAVLLRRLGRVERDKVFDEERGAYAQREDYVGVAVQVEGGPTWLNNDDGSFGGQLHLSAGVKLPDKVTVAVGMGLRLPAFSTAHLEADSPVLGGSYASGSFMLDITARQAFEPLFGRLEPVVGLSLRSRIAALEFIHPTIEPSNDDASAVSSFHLGLGVAPVAGLQWAAPLNEFGSRMVFFFELRPELMFWPVRSASDQTDGEFTEAPLVVEQFEQTGSQPTFQLGSAVGVRIEL